MASFILITIKAYFFLNTFSKITGNSFRATGEIVHFNGCLLSITVNFGFWHGGVLDLFTDRARAVSSLWGFPMQ